MTTCLQNTPRTSATVAHLGLRHGVHPLGIGSRRVPLCSALVVSAPLRVGSGF